MEKKKTRGKSKTKTGPKKEKKAGSEESKVSGFDNSPEADDDIVSAAKSNQDKLEDLKEIEKRMEMKIQQFQARMKEMDKARIQPITLQLIQKYSFTRKFKS